MLGRLERTIYTLDFFARHRIALAHSSRLQQGRGSKCLGAGCVAASGTEKALSPREAVFLRKADNLRVAIQKKRGTNPFELVAAAHPACIILKWRFEML
jgi:hypothetical protein